MRQRRPSPWNEDMHALFRRLCADETLSYTDIAAAMSEAMGVRLTKNACIGKARRLDMPMRKTPRRERKRTEPAVPARLVTPRVGIWAVSVPSTRRSNGALTLLELTRTTCHYPFGERPPYWYCGKSVREATPYCSHHCDVAYGRAARHKQGET